MFNIFYKEKEISLSLFIFFVFCLWLVISSFLFYKWDLLFVFEDIKKNVR